ncbi:MAG: VWA domain-containing protein [Acidobacteriota bacterium]
MTFRDPLLLWWLVLVPVVAAFLIGRERHRARLARRFVAERLRGSTNGLRPFRPWLFSLGLAALIVALAGPRRGTTSIPIEARESNRVIAIDVSNSMAATDVGTSRLDAAKAIARILIQKQSGRVGLVAFESSAEVISPLTSDGDAVVSMLDTLETGDLDSPGSDIGGAVDEAMRLAGADPAQRADIVVISDGEDQGTRLSEVMRVAKGKGFAVSTIMVGSAEGSTIPQAGQNGVLHDESGQVVTTYARADLLETLARQTGGTFYSNPFSEHALDALVLSGAAGAVKKRVAQVPIDRFQWPLGVALAACLCGSLAHRGAE